MAIYSGVFEGVAVSAAQDLFEYTAPSDAVAIIHKVAITDDTTETSEQLVFRIRRGATTTGSGGSTVTPAPLAFGEVAAGGVMKANNTTAATGGTIVTLLRESANLVGNGFLHFPAPESRIVLSPGQRLTVNLPTAPGSSRTLSGTMIVEEIGG